MERITYDEPKRLSNLEKHGFDFAALTVEFFLTATMADGNAPGRYLAVGEFGGVTISVIFAPLGSEAVSVISMRRASKRERKLL